MLGFLPRAIHQARTLRPGNGFLRDLVHEISLYHLGLGTGVSNTWDVRVSPTAVITLSPSPEMQAEPV